MPGAVCGAACGGGRARGRLAVPGPEIGEFGSRRGDVGQADRETHLVGDGVQHPLVGERRGRAADGRVGERGLELAGTPLPGEEGARLLHRGRHRKDHIGTVGDRAVPQLETDHEPRGVERGQGGRRIGQVGHLHAADHQRAEMSSGRKDFSGVAARVGREIVDVPGGAKLLARPSVGDGATTGQQAGQCARLDRTTFARAAGHPGRRRTRAVGQAQRGGQRAGRGGEPLADQNHRTRCAE